MKPVGRISSGSKSGRLYLDRQGDIENFKPGQAIYFSAYERPKQTSDFRVGWGRVHTVNHAEGSLSIDDSSGLAWNVACPALLDGDWIFAGQSEKRQPSFNHTRADGPFEPCTECLQRMTREQLIALVLDMRAVRNDAR